MRTFLRAHIGNVTLTDCVATVADRLMLCPRLMAAAGLSKYERVVVRQYSTHLDVPSTMVEHETYVVEGYNAECVLGGLTSEHFIKGQPIEIWVWSCEVVTGTATTRPRRVRVTEGNGIASIHLGDLEIPVEGLP